MNGRMKILVAYDGSECADVAIDDLGRAGLPEEAEALIVSVAEVWLPPPVDENEAENLEIAPPSHTPAAVQHMWARRDQIVQHAGELAERAGNRVEHNFPRWTVQHKAVGGSPAWELLRLDGEWQPTLIVVGSHGRTAIGRFVLGSVSQRVLTEARSSVRVARGKTLVGEPPQRIVIGVDGSASSLAAVKEVAARHWTTGSEAHVLVVHDPLMPTAVRSIIPSVAEVVEEVNGAERAWADKIADSAEQFLSGANLTVSTVIEAGDPKRILVDYAEEWEADSIFVGSTGFSSRVERLLLGSVSAAVAARAHCSVEVVRVK
jgi:nucleotide-binding universal stress UspA family protein